MDRIPAYVDDMGETIYADDLRAGLLLIKMRCRMGARNANEANRLKNKKATRLAEVKRKAQAEQRVEDLSAYLATRAHLDAEHIDTTEPPICFIPRTIRWG